MSSDSKKVLAEQMKRKPYGLEYITIPHGRMMYDLFPNRICHMNRFYDPMLIDGSDLLTIRHCLEIDNKGKSLQDNMDTFSGGKYAFYTKSIALHTSKMQDVYHAIVESLTHFKTTVCKDKEVQGPALLLLFQAPYYRDKGGDVINITNTNVASYNYQPHIALNQNVTREGIPDMKNNILAYILLPMHDVDGNKKNITDPSSYLASCLSWLRSKKSTSKVCKMFCLDDSSTFCGCINTAATPSISNSYDSVCSTTDTPPNMRDFGMVYRINENNPSVSGLFSSTYINDLDLD
jgi:hypothetical protein